ALTGLKVLDMTSSSEQYCGKMLAQLGAEVILVEPPSGAQSRRKGPFLNRNVHIECSLPFAYFNQGKRGLTLDIQRVEGQQVLHRLISQVDIVLSSAQPKSLAAL